MKSSLPKHFWLDAPTVKGTLLALAGAFIALIVLAVVFINCENGAKYSAIGAILAALGAIIAAFGTVGALLFLANQVRLQREAFRLEHRPYLYLHMDDPGVWFNDEVKGWFGGGPLRFRNVGKDPATITKTDYMVASDAQGVIDFKGWFEKDFGGFPDVTSVFPGQENAQVPCHPGIASGDKKPKLLYIGAVVAYVGPESAPVYWYKFSQLYAIGISEIRNEQGIEIGFKITLHPQKPDHDWDRNTDLEVPKLVEPDWQFYLLKPYIKQVTS